MVFPIESEDRTLRNLLMLCQDNIRLVIDAYRKTLSCFDAVTKNKTLEKMDQIVEIQKIIDEAIKIKVSFMAELNTIVGVLVSRDDFFRLVSTLTGMFDTIEVLAVRLIEIKAHNWSLSKPQAEGLAKMADLGFEILVKLRDSITSLGFNSDKAVAFANDVDDLEKQLDLLYVKVDLDIVTSSSELPLILLIRDIAKDIENLGDKVQEAADLVRILAF